ncbi:MAG: peptidase M14 [Anaerolineae bacterium]|nr:peptidase M14 [Anaerolineae bacterium]
MQKHRKFWKYFVYTGLFLSVWFSSLSPVAARLARSTPPPPEGDALWVVRATYTGEKMVRELTSWREPWEINRDENYLVLDVTSDEYARLVALGFQLEIDSDLTERLRQPHVPVAGQTGGITGYPCYRTVEETFATAEGIVTQYPDLATWIDIGDSWEKTVPDGLPGYDLWVLRLTNANTAGPKPKLFIMASVHAREYTTAELSTRFAEYLVQNYNVDADVTWLLDAHEIHLLLIANPDGRKHAEAGLYWRKNTNENYCAPTSNSRGADLNRNFAFQWGCCGGSSSSECDEVYRGPAAASEPETQAIQTYVSSQFSDLRADDFTSMAPLTTTGIFLDIHSYSELVLWPWGFTYNSAPNATGLQTLGRKFAYFNGYSPEQAIGLYPTDGTTDDFAYGTLGVAAYTFELGTAFFQSCATFENTIYPDNLYALLYAAKAARAPYMLPAGPEPLNVALSDTGVLSGTQVYLTATLDDTRFNHKNGTEPTQNIGAAEYYVDVPPWDTTATGYMMGAGDGAFDSPSETVTATVDTSGLGTGRHTLYVRGRDANGNWGVVGAAFLYIVENQYPDIDVIPAALEVTLFPDSYLTRTLTIHNLGRSDLTWTLATSPAISALRPWLTPITNTLVLPDTLVPLAQRILEVGFDSTGLPAGTYTTTHLLITSNDPDEPATTISASLAVDTKPITAVILAASTLAPFYHETPINFSLSLMPPDATLPFTYTLDYGEGPLSPALSTFTPLLFTHSFDLTGTHTITATAWNCARVPPVTDTLTLTLVERAPIYEMYLPLVLRQ